MHELGIVYHVADTVIAFAKKNAVTRIDTLVLQIGELSPVVPRYIEACYPAAVDGTILQDTKLQIEVTPAEALCPDCGTLFAAVAHRRTCPDCHKAGCPVVSGKEFLIKEIVAC